MYFSYVWIDFWLLILPSRCKFTVNLVKLKIKASNKCVFGEETHTLVIQ